MIEKKTPPVKTTDEATAESHNTSSAPDKQAETLGMLDLEKLRFEDAEKEAAAHIPVQWLERLSFDPKIRQRAWWFLLYPESMNPRTLEILAEAGVRGAVSPLHDRDVWPDGSPKKAHFHVILYEDGKTSYAALERIVRTVNGVRLEPCANITGAVRYLAHLDIQPDVIPGDVGKRRYNPDDIISLNGFDAQSYVHATQSQIAQALGELYTIIRDRDIISYDEFIDTVYTELCEYTFIMANPNVCSQVRAYICARYARTKAAADARQAAQSAKDAHDDLVLAANRMHELQTLVAELLTALVDSSDARTVLTDFISQQDETEDWDA